MKKIIFMVLCTAALLASCDTSGGGPDFSPLPDGVYIAGEIGSDKTKACYWAGGKRVILNSSGSITVPDDQVLAIGGSRTYSISVSDGTVLVTGMVTPLDHKSMVLGQYCYWVDGKRFSSGMATDQIIAGGKIYACDRYDYDDRGYWVDGVKITIDNFKPYVIAVSGGKVYAAGKYHEYFNYFDAVCYYVDGVRHNIDDRIWPAAITVSGDGKVYIAGNDWYYADEKVFKLQEFDGETIKRITLSGGKVYVFGVSSEKNYYWVDGEKVTVDLPEGSHVSDYAIANGTMYMAGYYRSGDKTQACYWVDGERYDLNGSMASAIFVEE